MENDEEDSIEEILTSISNLDNENYFTVARVMEGGKCVELHYNKGEASLEYGTRVAKDKWENEIDEDVEWFNLDLTDDEVLEHLNREYNDYFLEEQDVYEEYRQRLINNKAPILNLEIFETFIGTGFISNSYDLLEILIKNDTKQMIEELEEIKVNILEFSEDSYNNLKRYNVTERLGYYLIAEGYILRLQGKEQQNGKQF